MTAMATATVSDPERAIHPGAGRRKGRNFPKGRQVDPTALAEVAELLGARSRQRDLLIEHLHLIQDRYGCLHARHLAALADEMKLVPLTGSPPMPMQVVWPRLTAEVCATAS